ncbi:MAG: DUF3579 domain-containing protein [Gallionella sp.]|nr:DUF3579 domain-containing protein [Gallionella sp.]MDD4945619.1 DUF3579 domain-containing protein [Gallionella sp.]MDD5613183.1 DUF3579 domain-containing protein [Gallionella sp.]
MFRNQEEWVILGITMDGDIFEYPEWHERLCGMLAQQSGSNRLSYSDYLHPVLIEGLPAVVLYAKLEQEDPEAYRLVRKFADDNRLKVRTGRTSKQLTETIQHPKLGFERRDLTGLRGV